MWNLNTVISIFLSSIRYLPIGAKLRALSEGMLIVKYQQMEHIIGFIIY